MPTIATLTDVFNGVGFDVVSLTKAVQKIPPFPSAIQRLGIFKPFPVSGTVVAVEEEHGVLTLIPTTTRGGAGIPGADPKRVLINLTVPHIQVDDKVFADDVLNKRAFGSEDTMAGAGEVVARKFIAMRRSVDATMEYLRLGALQGIVTYPAGSVDAALNLYTVFGTTQQTANFALNVGTTEVVEAIIPGVRRQMEDALGEVPLFGIHVLCGRTFFANLISHAMVKALYNQQQAMWALSPVTIGSNRKLVIGDVTFEEYYGVVGGVTFISAIHAVAFPLADIYQTCYAPADYIEAIGSMGESMYAWQKVAYDEKSVDLQTQSNPLNICVRPRALVYCSNS